MSFLISNPNGGNTVTGISCNDTLPAGLTAPNGTTNPCGGTLVIRGGNTLAFTGGLVAAGANCTLSVTVTGTASGVQNNTTGAITSTESGPGTTSNTATVTVVAPPTIAKSFGAASIALNGTTTISFLITNPNSGSALTGISFNDTLPPGLTAPNGTTNPSGGTLGITGGTNP